MCVLSFKTTEKYANDKQKRWAIMIPIYGEMISLRTEIRRTLLGEQINLVFPSSN